MLEDIMPTYEQKNTRKFIVLSSVSFFAFFFLYIFYINNLDFSYRSIADALLWSVAVIIPVVVNIWSVFYKRTLKPYSLVSRMLGVYFFSIIVGVVLAVSYCEGEECLGTIGLVVVVSGYNVLLNSLFLYLHWSKNKKLYVD